MRSYHRLAVLVAIVFGGLALVAAGSAAAPRPRTTTLRYFLKGTGGRFVRPNGVPLPPTAKLKVRDTYFETFEGYAGSASRHARRYSMTASLYCTITKVLNPTTDAVGRCEVVVAIRNSTFVSVSNQRLSTRPRSTVFPIGAGTGRYLAVHGTIRTGAGNGKGFEVVIRFTR